MSDETALVEEDSVDSADVGSEVDAGDSSAAPATEAHAPQATAPAAPAQQSVWDAFKALPDFKGADDVAIARRLYAAMEREKAATSALAQYQQYIPYAQQYLQHREPFEKYLASQRQAAAQQSPEQSTASEAIKKWWNPPEVRDSYRQYLVKDENGREVISENAPLDAKHALYEYQKYKADFASKFLTNPQEALGPMVQEIAQQQAKQIVESQLQEVQQQQYVSGLEQENKDWLYGEDGQPTEEGLAANRYIQEAIELGIASPQQRWEYATKMVERDLLDKLRSSQQSAAQRGAFEAGLPQQNAPVATADAPASVAPNAPTQAEKDIEFLRRGASRSPSRSAGTSDPRTPQAPLTFEQRLAKQIGRDGIS